MDKVIVTMLLIVAGVAATMFAVNAVFEPLSRGNSAIAQSSDTLEQRLGTQVSIVQATSELSSTGAWVDANSDGKFDVYAWVKNVGSSTVTDPENTDVYFGGTGSADRIPYVTYAGGSYPSWSYSLENGSQWSNSKTLKIDIKYAAPLTPGDYLVKVITSSGGYDEQSFTF